MRRSGWLVILLMSGAVAISPAKTKKAELPQLFCQARYVYVETYEGDPSAPLVAEQYPLDSNAALGVEHRVESWGRYKLVYEQQLADLVLVVWKARPEENRLPGQPTQMPPAQGPPILDPGTESPGNPQFPGDPQRGPRQNPGLGGPDGVGVSSGGPGVATWPSKDQLAVYEKPSEESLTAPLWKKTEKDGLAEPDMTLFGKLADAVDDACSGKQ